MYMNEELSQALKQERKFPVKVFFIAAQSVTSFYDVRYVRVSK